LFLVFKSFSVYSRRRKEGWNPALFLSNWSEAPSTAVAIFY